jgi:hypothetical protein
LKRAAIAVGVLSIWVLTVAFPALFLMAGLRHSGGPWGDVALLAIALGALGLGEWLALARSRLLVAVAIHPLAVALMYVLARVAHG